MSTPRHNFSRRVTSEKWGRETAHAIPMWEAPTQRNRCVSIDQDIGRKPIYPTGILQPKLGTPGTGLGCRDRRPDDIERDRLQQDAFYASYYEHHPGHVVIPTWKTPEMLQDAYRTPNGLPNDLMEREPWENKPHDFRMASTPNADHATLARAQHGECSAYAHPSLVAFSGERGPEPVITWNPPPSVTKWAAREGGAISSSHDAPVHHVHKVVSDPRPLYATSHQVAVGHTSADRVHQTVGNRQLPRLQDHHVSTSATATARTGPSKTVSSYMQALQRPVYNTQRTTVDDTHAQAQTSVLNHVNVHKSGQWTAPTAVVGRTDDGRLPPTVHMYNPARVHTLPDNDGGSDADRIARQATALQYAALPHQIQVPDNQSVLDTARADKPAMLNGGQGAIRVTDKPEREEVDQTRAVSSSATVGSNLSLYTKPATSERVTIGSMSSRTNNSRLSSPALTSS